MKPIYKNKGCTTDPQHFRSITVLSCLGKVFTSILSERLTQYSDEYLVLCENKVGFGRGIRPWTIYVFFTFFSTF